MVFYRIKKINDVALIDIFNEIQPSAFAEDFGAIGQVSEIILRANSTGGDFDEAKKIYNLIKNHPAHKTGYVVTFAGSSAILPLMACETVSMPRNGAFLFHEPFASCQNATANTFRHTAAKLDEAMEFLILTYTKKSNLLEDAVRQLMRACTWIDGTEALEIGLCDEITDPVALVPIFDSTKFGRIGFLNKEGL